MHPLHIQNVAALADVLYHYRWDSKALRLSIRQVQLFAYITGDWNRAHVHPLTFFRFKSRLGGMACPGDLMLSLIKQQGRNMFRFREPTETISAGYDTVRFRRPLLVGERYFHRFILMEYRMLQGTMNCLWQIEARNSDGKLLCEARWRMQYCPLERAGLEESLKILRKAFRRS